jgi:FkbM family methyltransferase
MLIQNYLRSNAPILLYGTGGFARDVHRVLTQRGHIVVGFMDHVAPRAALPDGAPFFDLEKAGALAAAGELPSVVLGVHNPQADLPRIIRQLRALGFQHIIAPVQLYDEFGADLGDRYWLTSRSFYAAKAPQLEQVERMWSDQASRDLFRAVLAFRLTGDPAALPAPDTEHQYFPPDIPPWTSPIRLIDCGAFDGDTIIAMAEAGLKMEALAAFEPDLANFQKLAASVKLIGLREAFLWPCGVYSDSRQIAFDDGNGAASGISEHGKSVIQCVRLDDVLPAFRPTLIKMDIEGAEPDALLGARELICSHTPGLAISLYHRPEHLWELPFLVDKMAPGVYDFSMRLHRFNDFDLVMYAIPKRSKP